MQQFSHRESSQPTPVCHDDQQQSWHTHRSCHNRGKRHRRQTVAHRTRNSLHSRLSLSRTGLSGTSWMQAFSPECRTRLAHYGCHIAEEVHKSDGGKSKHTEKSRASHFLEWCKKISLNQDPCQPQQPLQARNYLLACFAVLLTMGGTIQG